MNSQTFTSNLLALCMTVAVGTLAVAHGARAADDMSGLSAFDKNKDGSISKEEYMETGGTEKSFATYDLNGDGKLDKSEFGKAKGGEASAPGTPAPAK